MLLVIATGTLSAVSGAIHSEDSTSRTTLLESRIGIVAPLSGGVTRLGISASFGIARDQHHVSLVGDVAFPLSGQQDPLNVGKKIPGNFSGIGLRYAYDIPGFLKSALFSPAIGAGWYRTVAKTDSVDYAEIYPLNLSPQFLVEGRRLTVFLDPVVHIGMKQEKRLQPVGSKTTEWNGVGVLFAPRFGVRFLF